MSNVIQQPQPRFDPKELVDLYQRQAYERLSVSFLEILGHFERQTYYSLDAQAQYFIDVFVKNFLYIFTQPDYVLTDQHAVRFIELNLAISNLVAMSGFRTPTPTCRSCCCSPAISPSCWPCTRRGTRFASTTRCSSTLIRS